jgi:hypothetical protein
MHNLMDQRCHYVTSYNCRRRACIASCTKTFYICMMSRTLFTYYNAGFARAITNGTRAPPQSNVASAHISQLCTLCSVHMEGGPSTAKSLLLQRLKITCKWYIASPHIQHGWSENHALISIPNNTRLRTEMSTQQRSRMDSYMYIVCSSPATSACENCTAHERLHAHIHLCTALICVQPYTCAAELLWDVQLGGARAPAWTF